MVEEERERERDGMYFLFFLSLLFSLHFHHLLITLAELI
jgi:hypothetical protein